MQVKRSFLVRLSILEQWQVYLCFIRIVNRQIDRGSRFHFYKDRILTKVWAQPCPFLLLLRHFQLYLACAAGNNQNSWRSPTDEVGTSCLVLSSCTSQELVVLQQQQEGTGLCPNSSKCLVLIKSGAVVHLLIDYRYSPYATVLFRTLAAVALF